MQKKVVMIATTLLLSACTTNPYTGESQVAKTAWTTGVGTAVGAGTGALIGGEKGALIGAGTGAAIGIGSGVYMDMQAAKLRKELESTGVRVQQKDNQIILIMPGNVTFGTNKYTIEPQFEPILASVAKVIKEYDRTKVQVIGYTDSTGSILANNALSLRRANAVSNFLRLNGVDINRIIVDGLGSQNPIAPNKTAAGREKNRRVEITLISVE